MVTVVMTISMKTVIMMLTLMLWALVPRALMPSLEFTGLTQNLGQL